MSNFNYRAGYYICSTSGHLWIMTYMRAIIKCVKCNMTEYYYVGSKERCTISDEEYKLKEILK